MFGIKKLKNNEIDLRSYISHMDISLKKTFHAKIDSNYFKLEMENKKLHERISVLENDFKLLTDKLGYEFYDVPANRIIK